MQPGCQTRRNQHRGPAQQAELDQARGDLCRANEGGGEGRRFRRGTERFEQSQQMRHHCRRNKPGGTKHAGWVDERYVLAANEAAVPLTGTA
jgi:hypothetical protein